MYQHNQLKLNWRHSPKLTELPMKLGEWILHADSFMDRLREYGANKPQVQLLRQTWQFPSLSEKRILQMTNRAYALIREVLIYSEGKKWMYARTVFPKKTLSGKDQSLARLKNRSLGSVLFKDPTIQRDPFDVVCLSNEMPFYHYVLEQAKITANELWARRSRFVLHNNPLLLTEVFLPDIQFLCR